MHGGRRGGFPREPARRSRQARADARRRLARPRRVSWPVARIGEPAVRAPRGLPDGDRSALVRRPGLRSVISPSAAMRRHRAVPTGQTGERDGTCLPARRPRDRPPRVCGAARGRGRSRGRRRGRDRGGGAALGSRRLDRTSPCSTCGCPTATASRSAARCARAHPEIAVPHADLVRRRRGAVRRDHGRRRRLRPEADPRHRPGRRGPQGRGRRVAARPGGRPQRVLERLRTRPRRTNGSRSSPTRSAASSTSSPRA